MKPPRTTRPSRASGVLLEAHLRVVQDGNAARAAANGLENLKMTTYRVTLADGQKFLMSANLAEAAASISANFHGGEDDWQGTPYQTADARHIPENAAKLVAEYFADGDDDCTEVESVIALDGDDAD